MTLLNWVANELHVVKESLEIGSPSAAGAGRKEGRKELFCVVLASPIHI